MKFLKYRIRFIVSLFLYGGSLMLFPCFAADEWVYTVRVGDNLWNVTERHLTGMQYVNALQQRNSIRDPYAIPPGTQIKIPVAWTKLQTTGVYAKVVHVHGRVLLKRANTTESIPVATGMQLYAGDEIQSENDTFVTLEFADKSRMRLQDNSQARINELKIFGDYGLVDTLIDLQQGRTESNVPSKSGIGTRFRIKTPSAISSVRGTDFRVGALAGGKSTASEVLSGKVAVSGDKKEIVVPTGFGTVTAVGASPIAPVKLLVAPDLGNTPVLYEQLPLVITLNSLSGAVAYRTQIASDQNFENLWSEFTTEKLPFRDGDIPDGDYWLRVRGIDVSGIEGHDAVLAFTLNARPEPPFILMPLPNGAVDPIVREFQWTIQSEASHYLVKISRDVEFFDKIVDGVEVIGNKYQLNDSLTPGYYFWRIASVSATEGIGPFTDAMSFRMPYPGPTIGETKLDKSKMTFAWRAGGEGQRFYFQFARDKEFKQLLHEENTAETQLTVKRPDGGKYFLRTKTIESDGFEGPWGPPQIIEVPFANPYWMLLPFAPLVDLLL